jgi:membrane peptidoglycan carboxypeptidase
MVDPLHALDATTAADLEYPTTVRRYDPAAVPATAIPVGNTGLLVRHILSELSRDPAFKRPLRDGLGTGGYRIVSTVDAPRQRLAEKYAGVTDPASPRRLHAADIRAAMVAVEPRTGRVVAYYGGDADSEDYAGTYYDDLSGLLNGFGRHPPGGSFAPYDLAAALRAGVSVKSMWDARPRRDFPEYGRSGPTAVTDTRSCPTRGDACTLAESVQAGLNVPLFGLAAKLGPTTVVDMARRAGVDALWTDDLRRVDLRESGLGQFGAEVGVGQYPITVLDHANGMATFAAHGQRARAHFVASVSRGGTEVYREDPAVRDIGLSRPQLDDLTWTMAQNKAGVLADGRRSAAVAGAWAPGRPSDVAHSWTAGFTWQLATAVWVGNGAAERPLRDAAALPPVIYQRFMAEALAGTPPMQIPAPVYGGDAKAGNASR